MLTPFSPLARGLLTGQVDSLRNKTDNFTADQYGDETSQNIAQAVARVAAARGVKSSQVALAWVSGRAGVTSTLIGVETVAQLDENIATLDMQLTPQELHEIDRWYTPCDVINDYHTARIPRVAR